MNTLTQILLSDLVTFVVTMLGCAYTMGKTTGSVKSELAAIKERLVRIEAMFELRLKDLNK